MATTQHDISFAEEQNAKADKMPLVEPPDWKDCGHCMRPAVVQLRIGSGNMASVERLCRVCADRLKAAL